MTEERGCENNNEGTWFSLNSVMLLFRAIPRRTQFSGKLEDCNIQPLCDNVCFDRRNETFCNQLKLDDGCNRSDDGEKLYFKTEFWQYSPYRVYLKFFIHLKWALCGNWFISVFSRKCQMKKVSSPHYLKILVKSSKHGLSYSLKRDSSSIPKTTFYGNLRVNSIDMEL